MKALRIENQSIPPETLLRMAEEIPGAWIGIRIAALLLIEKGWKSTQVADIFNLSRWGVVKMIHRANEEGADALRDKPRPGRPPKVTGEIKKKDGSGPA